MEKKTAAPDSGEAGAVAPKRVGVRRSKSGNAWCVADQGRDFFVGGFAYGLMTNVSFDPQAKAMTCVEGYDSTGEAVGVVSKSGHEKIDMPGDAKRSVSVVYDPEKRLFHEKGKIAVIVEAADYLLLNPDGTALAGYKK